MSVPNWKRVGPGDKKKLEGILKWARTTKHPHTKCKRALMERGVSPERADRICAVMKDMALRTTKWRKGGGRSVKGRKLLSKRK